MMKIIGLFALVIMVAAEVFSLSAAIFWPIAAITNFIPHDGELALAAAAVLGAAAGVGIWRIARANGAFE